MAKGVVSKVCVTLGEERQKDGKEAIVGPMIANSYRKIFRVVPRAVSSPKDILPSKI